MSKRNRSGSQPSDEMEELKHRLAEREETLHAIQQYLVDAFVVNRSDGAKVFTLEEADFPYRLMVEAMNEGAVTLLSDGTILFANPRFCEMVQVECNQLIGLRFQDLILPAEQEAFTLTLQQVGIAGRSGVREEFCLRSATEACIPVQVSIYELATDGARGLSVIVTDLTERVLAEKKIRSLALALTKAEQEERHRISQILHDDLQQRLFAVKAQLSMLTEGNLDGLPLQVHSELEQIQRSLSDTISITRNLSISLSPAILRGEGLGDAILWLASQMREQFDLQVEIDAKVNLNQLEEHIRVLLFRAVRELLFNIVKHAGTRQAAVHLEQVDGRVCITVTDEGAGFDAEKVLNDLALAHGLLILRDRLNLMGGTMEVDSKVGKGTRVRIEMPVEIIPA